MKHLQKSRRFLFLAMSLILAIAMYVPASAFDAARLSHNCIAAGYDQVGMVDENGTLWMWGNGKFGQLGK